MNNGLNNKKWYQSRIVKLMIGAILASWASYLVGEISFLTAIASTLFAVAGTFFRFDTKQEIESETFEKVKRSWQKK